MMPNWCDTTYKIVGDKKDIKTIHNALKYIDKRKTTILKNGFGRWWLGNLIHTLGGDWKNFRCRGEIIGQELESPEILTIWQNTAWCEQEGVRQFLEAKFPSVKVYWKDEEPGCGNYTTNNASGDYFPERYILDYTDGLEYFNSLEAAAEFVKDLTGKDVKTEEDIEVALNEQEEKEMENDDDAFYSFNKFKVLEEDEP